MCADDVGRTVLGCGRIYAQDAACADEIGGRRTGGEGDKIWW